MYIEIKTYRDKNTNAGKNTGKMQRIIPEMFFDRAITCESDLPFPGGVNLVYAPKHDRRKINIFISPHCFYPMTVLHTFGMFCNNVQTHFESEY